MAKIALTDAGLRSIKLPSTGQQSYWDKSLPSFGVRVSQGGSKTFVLNRSNSLITIGRFPILSLSQARTQAKVLLAEFTLGKVRPQSVSYQQAVELFLEEKAKARRARTVADYKRLLNRLNWKGPLVDLTHSELQRRLRRFTAPAEYNHILVALKVFCNWCRKGRYITDDPTLGLTQHATTSRERVLTTAELKAIWKACEAPAPDLPANYRTIVKLLILTGQRKGEIAALRTNYITDDLCTLPATLTKNGREHAFPLCPLAAALLRDISPATTDSSAPEAQMLFPARGHDARPLNGWSKSKVALDEASGVTDWRLHDLRRTFRSGLGELGVAPHIAERLVNHVSSQSRMERVYNKYRYLPEMRVAIRGWESHLRRAVIR